MLNRSLTPEIHDIDSIHFVEPKIYPLQHEVKLFLMKEVFDETVRIEFHFQAGSIHGVKNAANFVNSLLFSGTNKKSSTQIHEELDQLGAYLDQEISSEKAFVSVYCLRKNIEKVLDIVHDAITNVAFLDHEIADMIQQKKQRLLVSLEKVNFLARRGFQKHLFASNITYNRQLELDDFAAIKIEDLKDFHGNFYLKGLAKIVVVSDLEDEVIGRIISKFEAWSSDNPKTYESNFVNNKGVFLFEKKDAIQTAIRIGVPLFNKRHEDFSDFQFLQTILGDYFGSRLMSNIREDKGYTYGIGCSLVETKKTGYFVIATEVGKEVCDATLSEIKYELERLQNEPIPKDELNLVKNYLVGQLLKSADGPNSMMDMFLNVYDYQLNVDFYAQYLKNIKSMNAETIQILAKKYLNWSDFTIITAG
jgi:zinc protease